MAKKPAPLSLSQLTASLKTTDLKMNPAIQAQIEAAMSQSAPVQSPELNNNVKSLTNAIKENSIILTKGRSNSSQSDDMTETEIEDEKKVKYQIRLLEKIEENTRGLGSFKKDSKEPTEEKSFVKSAGKLGLLLTTLALSLGIIVGAIRAYAKIVWGITKAIGSELKTILIGLKNITPESIKTFGTNLIKTFKNSIDILAINVTNAFGTATEFFKNRFPKTFSTIEKIVVNTTTFVNNVYQKIVSSFKLIGSYFSKAFNIGSTVFEKVGEIFKSIRTSVNSFLRPFKVAAGVISNSIGFISNSIQNVSTFFSNIASKFAIFSKIFKLGAFIGAKIPFLNVIIGGIVGIFDAFKEFGKSGSIIKSLGAFAKGAVKIIVTDFLDFLKDGVSWISEKLGFKDFAKMLDSFSFTEIYNKFVDEMVIVYEKIGDVIMEIPNALGDFFKSIGNWLAGIKIPEVDIPLLGKFGPWQPFGGLGESDAPSKSISSTTIKPMNVPMDQANNVYSKSAQVDAAKTTPASKEKTTIVSAPSQVNTQTQNAFMKTPIRNNDGTVNRYLNSAFNI